MEWIMNNQKDVLLIITSIVTIASIIVKLTPSKKDDEVVGKIRKIIELLSLKPKDK